MWHERLGGETIDQGVVLANACDEWGVAVRTNRRGLIRHTDPLRATFAAIVTLLVVAVLGVATAVMPATRLLANTVMAMGGNGNPDGLLMNKELNGYLNTDSPKYGFPGYDFTTVHWPAGWTLDGFNASVNTGVENLDAAIKNHYATAGNEDDKVVVVGYSSSAIVTIRELRALAAEGSPYADNLSFIVFGNPSRPNGGIFTRFPGVSIPVIDIPFDPANPDGSQYSVTDLSWEYDTISDFPTYPLNLLATLNSLVAFLTEHSIYYDADLSYEIPELTYTANGITYKTLRASHIPLLQPLAALGVPDRLLGLVEPVLRVLIDFGYDRTIPAGTTTPAKWLPPVSAFQQLGPDLANAIREGINNLLGIKNEKASTVTVSTTDSSTSSGAQLAAQSTTKQAADSSEATATEASESETTETAATETASETPAAEKTATEKTATETPATETSAAETPATETAATETPETETPATETPAATDAEEGSVDTGAVTESPAKAEPDTTDKAEPDKPVKAKDAAAEEDSKATTDRVEPKVKPAPGADKQGPATDGKQADTGKADGDHAAAA